MKVGQCGTEKCSSETLSVRKWDKGVRTGWEGGGGVNWHGKELASGAEWVHQGKTNFAQNNTLNRSTKYKYIGPVWICLHCNCDS